jgi:hypothetical protein
MKRLALIGDTVTVMNPYCALTKCGSNFVHMPLHLLTMSGELSISHFNTTLRWQR